MVWDLKAAKFNGETEPRSDCYVAVVCEEEVVLLLGDLKKDAYRKTGSRPAEEFEGKNSRGTQSLFLFL